MATLPDNLHFIERDWLSCNQIMMFDDGLATLIDTGFHKHRELTLQLVMHSLTNHQPDQPAKLSRIINTHLHSDHCGANAALANEHQCQIVIPAACEQAVQTWDSDQLSFNEVGQFCERFSAQDVLSDGDQFTAGGLTWNAHAAPGHDPTSLIFFAAAPRILISADAFWEHGFGLTFPEIYSESGFNEQGAVLDLIESLEPAIVLPGHGPIFTDTARAMSESRSRLAALQADPARIHRTALKTLVTFTMLDAERASLSELIAMTDRSGVLRTAAGALDLSLPNAIGWAADRLVEQRILKRDDGYLISH